MSGEVYSQASLFALQVNGLAGGMLVKKKHVRSGIGMTGRRYINAWQQDT